MKSQINLSINPSYFCNFRCNFCYLSDEQLGSSKKIDPKDLFEKLQEISLYRKINHIDLYGGEIGLLPKGYFTEIKEIIKYFYNDKISIISNLSIINPLLLEDDIDLSVSWDFLAREKHEIVYQNMKNLDKDFHLLILASKKLLDLSEIELQEFIHKLSLLKNLKTVEIKPYSKNQSQVQEVSFLQHENWVKKWLLRSEEFSFEFINKTKLNECLDKKYSTWSDEHIYITPNNKFAVLEFDNEFKEYFLELNSLQEYFQWSISEKRTVSSNKYCSKCKYLGSCLSEHLQIVDNLENSCNGFKGLLDWYSDARI